MQVDGWDPGQYERFTEERAQPFHDLLGLVQRVPAARVVDLGCGAGALTRRAHDTLGASETVGVDNSAAMLREASAHASDRVRFVAGDIARFGSVHNTGAFDVVLSNAALQWVSDHAAVLGRWVSVLAPGGQLAFQVPANADHASHRTAVEVAHEPVFAHHFAGAPPPDPVRSVLPPEEYADLLAGMGFASQHVRLQVYGHWLASTDDVVEWVKGTSLIRFKRVLPPDVFDAFVERYRTRIRDVLGDQRPYFYPFKRILVWGRKGDRLGGASTG